MIRIAILVIILIAVFLILISMFRKSRTNGKKYNKKYEEKDRRRVDDATFTEE